MSFEDQGILRQLFDWAWAGVLGLGALVYRRQEEDLSELKEGLHKLRNCVVSKEEFHAHEARDERDRGERQSSENLLFKKVDDLKDDLNNKFDSLKTLILEIRK